MTVQETIVADDWTRNWQANIAVKITAMVLWVVIVVTFMILVSVIWHREQFLHTQYDQQTGSLQAEINDYLSHVKEPGLEKLISYVEQEAKLRSFAAVELSVAGEEHVFGTIPQSALSEVFELKLPEALAASKALTGQLTVYQQPFRMAAILESKELVIGVGLAILAFGIFLTWIIHTVISKPFQTLIEATKRVSAGHLDTHIDFIRQDEFGHLSQFFNEMLIRVSNQQQELIKANEELKKEITVRTGAEQSLLLHQQHLEKIVQDLAIARDQALQANQTKSAFIANMSHEVRTPLTAIIGFGESILEGGQTEGEKHDAVRTVINNGRYLLRIINDILDMSKMEAGKLEVEKIAMSPFHILTDIESLISMQARDKGLKFGVSYEFPLPGMIISDPTRLKQILLNVCANAVKFTQQGLVHVTVSSNVAMQQMVFVVSDSGVGMSDAAQQRLFTAFSQADSSTTRKFGGTGLGLYISKRLAHMLGGDIRVESVEGVGSKFIISIDTGPLDKVQFINRLDSMQPSEDSVASKNTRLNLQGRVLLAEDGVDNQRLIVMYLRRVGDVDVTVVENGSLAVEQALSGDFDLILMDMQMPIMGGLEAVTLLRRAGYSRPIIALTANVMKEDQAVYIAAGCDGFLSKPIDQPKFFAVLAERLKGNAQAGQCAEDVSEDCDAEFRQLVVNFIEGLPAHCAELDDAMSNNRFEAARAVAHMLKGMGGSFGYPEITRLATLLEKSLKNKVMENVGYQYVDLRTEIDRVCDENGVPKMNTRDELLVLKFS